MIGSASISPLWRGLPDDFDHRVALAVEKGLDKAPGGAAKVFFRADDVGVPGNAFTQLTQAFGKRRTPLCLAVVPAWLTQSRFATLKKTCGEGPWCWCQHGWRHVNFEPAGAKKREFGSARPAKDKKQDISRGATRLREIMGPDFTPVFSPPWNRCDGESMAHMAASGIKALSRTVGAGPEPPSQLPDFPISVDLHTRKEPDPAHSLERLLGELETGLASGLCGVMIHHQRMNPRAFHFLDVLLDRLPLHREARIVHFGNLLEGAA